MRGILGRYRCWREDRALAQALPYYRFALHRRVAAAFFDFLPFSIVMVYYLSPDSAGGSRELTHLHEAGVMFLAWTVPKTVGALLVRGSFAQLLLGGEIRRSVDGARVSAARAGLRNLLGVLDSVPGFVLLNFLMVLVRRDRRTCYDLVAGTVMVDSDRVPPEDWSSQVEAGGFDC